MRGLWEISLGTTLTCHLCFGPIEAGRVYNEEGRADLWALTWDHVIPRSQGGSNHPSNLRPAHFYCNIRRSNAPLEEHWQALRSDPERGPSAWAGRFTHCGVCGATLTDRERRFRAKTCTSGDCGGIWERERNARRIRERKTEYAERHMPPDFTEEDC